MTNNDIPTVKLSDVQLHPDNPNQGDVGAISESIRLNDWWGTITVNGRKEAKTYMTVLVGNHRVMAARQLRMEELPVYWVDKSDEEALAILLADNRASQLATNDDTKLVELLKSLNDEGLLENSLYDGDDLDQLLADLDRNNKDADETPSAPKTTNIKLGDMFQLGEHRVLCGDSTISESFDRVIDGQMADMAFTDPPYGVSYDGGIQFDGKGNAITGARDKIANDHSAAIYSEAIPLLADYVEGPIYTWFAGTEALRLYQAIESIGGEIHAMIVWVKPGGYGALNANYKQKHEPCLYWKPSGSTLRFKGPSTETTIWDIDKDGRNELHPTQKPVALAEKALRNHDARIVLDPFLGSGSTLIACEKLHRKCYGMEIDPIYVDVIIKRWEEFTGKKAKQIGQA